MGRLFISRLMSGLLAPDRSPEKSEICNQNNRRGLPHA
ncbi:hypothetical protein CES86_1556 [Brucella lupini]|uniref:Uncharacterized protein n=1 Tax=Brucella lupini TaxID=255457 RepID=A0A256GVE4_9HYPH|nr:hypothetical protein CES86_1556 [Brucella lupini]